MKTAQLLYVSRATVEVDQTLLSSIANQAREKNSGLGVTGALLFCGGYFFQLLEGDDQLLTALFHHICKDPRHTDVQLIWIGPTRRRIFSDWAMTSLHETVVAPDDKQRINEILGRIREHEDKDRISIDARRMLRQLKTRITGHGPSAFAA